MKSFKTLTEIKDDLTELFKVLLLCITLTLTSCVGFIPLAPWLFAVWYFEL